MTNSEHELEFTFAKNLSVSKVDSLLYRVLVAVELGVFYYHY